MFGRRSSLLLLVSLAAVIFFSCQSGVGSKGNQSSIHDSSADFVLEMVRFNGLPLAVLLDNPQQIGIKTEVQFSAEVSTANAPGVMLVANSSDIVGEIDESDLPVFDQINFTVSGSETYEYTPGSTGTKLDEPGPKVVIYGVLQNQLRYISTVIELVINDKQDNTSDKTSVSHNGITWTFDKTYPTGTFVDGSPYVVGEPVVVHIDPATEVIQGNWIRHPDNPPDTDHWENGSMLNVGASITLQGISERMYWKYSPNRYDPNLNVATQTPLQLHPGDTLISADSYDGLIDENNSQHKESVDYYGYLTVLATTPPANSFRPPWIGLPNKQVEYTTANLRAVESLPKLTLAEGAPTIDSLLASYTAACFGDNGSTWMKQMIRHLTCDPYGKGYATQTGHFAMLAIADIPDADKQLAVNFLVQRGLDLYAILTNGGEHNLMNNGGHHHGRVMPVLFAGYMLNHSGMLSLFTSTNDAELYNGEAQVFYVDQNDINSGRYNQGDLGVAEWGIRHGTDPSKDNRDWGAKYRQCCTFNSMWAHNLLFIILGLEGHLRNGTAMPDYQSRYRQCQDERGVTGLGLRTSQFQLDMWDLHSTNYREWDGMTCPD